MATASVDVKGVVGLVVLKQPRVGSTWLKKELNCLPGVHLEVSLTACLVLHSAALSVATPSTDPCANHRRCHTLWPPLQRLTDPSSATHRSLSR